MRYQQTLLFLLSLITAIHALALPAPFQSIADGAQELYKRKGGGGGRGGGSSGGSSSGGSRGSSSSSSSSSSSGGTSSSGSRTGSSGVTPSFGGGRYYGGGATSAYRSGRSGGGLGVPYLAGGAALGALGGVWLYGAYAYNYPHYYYYHNDTSNQNVSHPATCLCGRYQDCGCGDTTDNTTMNQIANNASLSQLAVVNGTETLVVNGTLPNGTATEDNTGAAAGLGVPQAAGVWVVMAGVTIALNCF